MTADTVFLNDAYAGAPDTNDLGFEPKGEHECMTGAVAGFERVCAREGIVWDVAIVADRYAGMATAFPCGELRSHNMTIEAGARIVG
jgi:hypothetical protein